MTAAYHLAVALHVGLSLLGLAALGVTTGYAGLAWRRPGRPAVARFFAGGPGWTPLIIYVAAGVGLVAAVSSRGRISLTSGWVTLAGGLWLLAALALELLLRPAARQLGAPEPPPGAARRALGGAAWAEVLLIGASVVMTVKVPG